jgi:hypothetical protein
VGYHDASRRGRPGHDLGIGRPRVPDGRSVHGVNTQARERLFPRGRDVHVEHERHARCSSISRSSARHAA